MGRIFFRQEFLSCLCSTTSVANEIIFRESLADFLHFTAVIYSLTGTDFMHFGSDTSLVDRDAINPSTENIGESHIFNPLEVRH